MDPIGIGRGPPRKSSELVGTLAILTRSMRLVYLPTFSQSLPKLNRID